MQVLVMTEQTQEAIKKLVAYAEANPFSMDDLLDRHNGEATVPGNLSEYTLEIPIDFKIVYTIEATTDGGKARHLSMSINRSGKMPSQEIVQQIMDMIGFVSPMEECRLWLENILETDYAINVAEQIKS